MSAVTPPPGPSWIKKIESDDTSTRGKRIYTYTISLDAKGTSGGIPRTVTIKFEENAALKPEELAVRELGHFILLKQMHELGKRKTDENPFKIGQKIELITDDPNIIQSKRATFTVSEGSEKPNYYDASGKSQKLPADKAHVFKPDHTNLEKSPKSARREPTFIERCAAIRRAAFKSFNIDIGDEDPLKSRKKTTPPVVATVQAARAHAELVADDDDATDDGGVDLSSPKEAPPAPQQLQWPPGSPKSRLPRRRVHPKPNTPPTSPPTSPLNL